LETIIIIKLTGPKTSRSASGPIETMESTVPSVEPIKGVQRISIGPIAVLAPAKMIDDSNTQNYALLGRGSKSNFYIANMISKVKTVLGVTEAEEDI
jgi:hypothetical protein